MKSPYDESRAHSAPPPSRGVPGLAIACMVPAAGRYAPGASWPMIAILLPFRRLYDDNGDMRHEISIEKDPRFKCYVDLKPLEPREEIYVNFGGLDPMEYLTENPDKKNQFQLKSAEFVDAVFTRFQSYTAPRKFDFCMKDTGFARSRDIINMCAGPGPFQVRKKATTPTRALESVATFYEKIWRRSAIDNHWIEALLIPSLPVGACYRTDDFEFSAPSLQPSADDKIVLEDNEKYLKDIQDFLKMRVREANALLCAITNYGDLSGLHPTYVDRVNKTVVEIGGHTDDMGTDKHNKALSAKRAKMVKDYLAETMNSVLTYPPSVVTTFDATSERLAAKGYAATECATKNPKEDRSCRKISVRLADRP